MPHCVLWRGFSPLVVLFEKSTESYPRWGFMGVRVHKSSSVNATVQAQQTHHLPCLSFLRQEAKPVSEHRLTDFPGKIAPLGFLEQAL